VPRRIANCRYDVQIETRKKHELPISDQPIIAVQSFNVRTAVTQYTHLSEMPGLEIGQRVRMGERIGLTGNSGTGTIAAQGQGKKGARPALHFGVHYSTSGQYAEIRAPFPFEAIVPVDGYWMDPVALFRKMPPFDSASMKALPDAEKQVSVSIMFEDGETLPAKQKIVWPDTCTRT